MPKTFYASEADIPADQKGAYAQKADGKWWLTDLENDHPVVQTKTSLEATQTSLKTTITDLTNQKTELERKNQELSTKGVPDGYKAVPDDVAELGNTAKAEGLTKEQIPTMKKEHAQLKQDEEIRTQTKHYEDVASDESVGMNPAAFSRIALQEKLKIEKVVEKIDGNEVTKFVVVEKDGEGEKKTNVKDFVEKSAAFQPFKASLFEKVETKPNTKFPRQKERETGSTAKTAAERRIEKQNQRLVENEKANNAGAK